MDFWLVCMVYCLYSIRAATTTRQSSRQRSFYIVIVLILLTNTSYLVVSENSDDCKLIKRTYLSMNLPIDDMSMKGNNLRVCPISKCCSEAMENKLSEIAYRDGLQIFIDIFVQHDSYLQSRIKSFGQLFQSLFKDSYNEMNSMFTRSYGLQYLENKPMIKALFNELQDYHRGRVAHVKPVLNRFFKKLFRKMFVLINRRFQFDDNYLKCAEGMIVQLNPFGERTNILIHQLTRAFLTTRTYVQSLQVARSIIKSVSSQMTLNSECQKSLLQLRFCNLCAEQAAVLPCPAFCFDVIRECFQQHALLQPHWTKFLDALSRTAETVSGPFNLKVILMPLGYHISDSIMAFQQSNDDILKKIRQGCGQKLIPKTGKTQERKKREVNNAADSGSPRGRSKTGKNFGWRYENSKDGRDSISGNLGRLVNETMNTILKTKNLWGTFASEQLCPIQRVAAAHQACWNGSATHSYEKDRRHTQSTSNTPQVEPIILSSIELLKLATNNLEKARKGEEVDYITMNIFKKNKTLSNAIEMEDGSGSGSEPPKPLLARTTSALPRTTPHLSPDEDDSNSVEELGSGVERSTTSPPTSSFTRSVTTRSSSTTSTPQKSGAPRPDEEIDGSEEDMGSGGVKSVIPSIEAPVKEVDGSRTKVSIFESNLWPKEKSGKGGSEIDFGSGSVKESVKVVSNEQHVCLPPKCSSLSITYHGSVVGLLLSSVIIFHVLQCCGIF